MGKDRCLDVPQITTETLVLGLDLVGLQLGNTKDIGRALRKKEAEKAIQEAVKKENAELTKQFLKGKPITADKAQESLTDVGKAAGKATLKHAEHQLSEGLGCGWKRSPMGIWVDENQWVLYIVVPVLVGGAGVGAGYMYRARVGDIPAGILTSLAEPRLRFKPVGSLTFGLSDIKFVPSQRTVETKVFTEIQWKPINIGFSVFGGVTDGQLSKAKLLSQISYTGSGATNNLKLDLNTFVQHDAEKGMSFGGGTSATYKTRLFDVPLRLGAEASWEEKYTQQGRQTVWSTYFMLGSDF
jgi:hypothetical protein